MVRIEDWSIVQKPLSVYDSPEMRCAYLQGIVYGHPQKKDGTQVITSRIVLSHKTVVATQSGNIYRLGSPSKNYIKWLNDVGYDFNPNEPIRLIGPNRFDIIESADDYIENQCL